MNDVPRIAATLASLMLIAGAIGVNIARYPAVWQMVDGLDKPDGPAVASEPSSQPVPATAASQTKPAAQPARTSTATARTDKVAASATPAIASKKKPQAKAKTPAGPAAPRAVVATTQNLPPASVKPAETVDRNEPVGHILGVRPLVAVTPPGTSGTLSEQPAVEEPIRRLPPPDAAVPSPLEQAWAGGDMGPVPAYPTTSTP